MPTKLRTLFAVVPLLMIAACGSSGGQAATTTTEAPATTTPAATDDATDGEADDATDAEAEEDEDDAVRGEVLIEDSFDDDENGWGPQSDDAVDLSIEGGAFNMVVPSGDARGFVEYFPDVLLGAAEEGDLDSVEATAEISWTSPASPLLACYVDPDLDSTAPGGYFFVVYPNGQAAIAKRLDSGEVEYLDRSASADDEDAEPLFDADDPDDLSVELGMRCEPGDDGVELTLSLDGEEILSTTDDDDPYDGGLVEIVGARSKAAVEEVGERKWEIHFESLTVTDVS
jgi:hypothetical protein